MRRNHLYKSSRRINHITVKKSKEKKGNKGNNDDDLTEESDVVAFCPRTQSITISAKNPKIYTIGNKNSRTGLKNIHARVLIKKKENSRSRQKNNS